jgi:hypothetical protein
MKMLGRDDHGFVDIAATALKATISGSILADPRGLLLRHQSLIVLVFPGARLCFALPSSDTTDWG